jgi:hypothetical protein
MNVGIWDCSCCAVPFLEIFVSSFRYCVFAVYAVLLVLFILWIVSSLTVAGLDGGHVGAEFGIGPAGAGGGRIS